MEWPRLKNIILLLLLITNLCLMGLTAGEEIQTTRQARQAWETAVLWVQEQDIKLSADALPYADGLTVQRGQRNVQRETQLAGALLGAASPEALAAQVYRYSGDGGSIQFHSNGEFQASLAAGTAETQGRPPAEHAQEFFRNLGFEVQILSAEGDAVWLRQYLDGVPLLNCQVALHYEATSLVGMTEGRWLLTEMTELDEQTISPATALMSFMSGMHRLGVVFREITQITPAYYATASITGEMRLTPVWHVLTDTGAYRLDLITGELHRMG